MVDPALTHNRKPKKWALLVGINEYPRLEDKAQLRGCLNDVDAIEKLLAGEQFGFPPDHVLKLTSPAGDSALLATRDNILAAFRTHLAGNEAIAAGDAVVFYYSGHGSQIPDVHNDEEDGADETLVPCDVGPDRDNADHVRDISDDELSLLLDQLAGRTQNINLFFDSCHSGTMTRKLQDAQQSDAQGRARWLPPATCPVPAQLELPVGPRTRAMGPSDWLPLSDGYVLISACKASERAREGSFRIGMHQQLWDHGFLTYYLLEALRDVGPETTYHDIWHEVQRKVTRACHGQHPQIEGAREPVAWKASTVRSRTTATRASLSSKVCVPWG
ncbi:caspase domain-containing protein [Chloroflexota bacterium]